MPVDRTAEPVPEIVRMLEDQAALTQVLHCVQFAVRDLQGIMATDNLLLGELVMRELEVAVGLETRLQRMLAAVNAAIPTNV